VKLAFLVACARPYAGRLALVAAVAIAGSLTALAVPWLAGQVLGGVIAGGVDRAGTGIVLLVGALVGTAFASASAAILSAATSSRILADLRAATHRHVQSLPMAFHDSNRTGDLIALMTYEVNNLGEFLSSTLARVPAMVVTAAGAIALLFLIDPSLALIVPLVMPVAFVALKYAGRRMRRMGEDMCRAEADLIVLAERDLEMLPAIKSFAVEQRQDDAYRQQAEAARALQFSYARLNAILSPAVALVASLAVVALVVLGGEGLSQAQRTPAELFSFLLYAALLTRPAGELADLYGKFQWARGTLERLESVLSEPAEPGYAMPAIPGRSRGEIRFEGVSFTYPGRQQTLVDVDLFVKAGDVVALVGENGAGKSTLINLLFRFYQPDAGRILIDGQDIAGIQVQALRRQIGLVPQRALMFDGTVRENIAFGLVDPFDPRIEQAAKLAQAEEFIASLSEGYETRIGDHGVRLSGGQRQRIVLARALVTDPPILVFDEATSMYDLDAELAFVEACGTALAGRTVLIVTHRPASLALADRVVEMQAGRIVPPAVSAQ
jgi:ATP-binding cassette, subfamily B, bacterial